MSEAAAARGGAFLRDAMRGVMGTLAGVFPEGRKAQRSEP
jgi:hypothetical protein